MPNTFFFLRQGLALLPKLEGSDAIIVHCNLEFLGSSYLPTSASHQLGLFVEMMMSSYVAHSGLKLLASSNPLAMAKSFLT